MDVHPITLVGGGPGSPGLLTLRAAEALSTADVVLHAPDVAPELLALARPEARRHSQEDGAAGEAAVLRALEAAESGARVAWLLPGDPATSTAGASALRALAARGAAVEVVPGIGTESAALAYAGVALPPTAPLALVRIEGEESARRLLTLESAATISAAAGGLLAAGLPGSTTAAVVERPATPAQRVAVSTLAELARNGSHHGAESTLIAGEGIEARTPWFERRPLFGRRVVVTRPRAQAAGLVEWLTAQGAEPVSFPAIRIVAPPDPGPLAAAAAGVRGYDWVVFTSVNGVERFWWALEAAGLDARALGGARVAAIGPATAAALVQHGLRADVVPPRYVAEAVVEALAAEELRGRRVLLPRAAGARDVLPVKLEALGAQVTEVEAYRSVPDVEAADSLRRRLEGQEIDAVTFTSSSTVSNFVDALGADVGRAVVACIGPITAATATRLGMRVDLVAEEHTVPGLERVLVRHFGGS